MPSWPAAPHGARWRRLAPNCAAQIGGSLHQAEPVTHCELKAEHFILG